MTNTARSESTELDNSCILNVFLEALPWTDARELIDENVDPQMQRKVRAVMETLGPFDASKLPIPDELLTSQQIVEEHVSDNRETNDADLVWVQFPDGIHTNVTEGVIRKTLVGIEATRQQNIELDRLIEQEELEAKAENRSPRRIPAMRETRADIPIFPPFNGEHPDDFPQARTVDEKLALLADASNRIINRIERNHDTIVDSTLDGTPRPNLEEHAAKLNRQYRWVTALLICVILLLILLVFR